MNNLLQNLQQNLQKIPQSAKVLAVAGLLAAALVTWYLIAFRPAQDPALAVSPTPVQPVQPTPAQPSGSAAQTGQAQPQTTQGQASNPTPTAARPLEVVPLPFLRADGSAPTPANTGNNSTTTQANPSSGSGTTSVASAPAKPALPPNPFAPLITENQTPTNPASAVPSIQGPSTQPVPTARPIPTQQARVQITPSGTGLPRIPGLPGSRSTPTVTQTPSVPVATSRTNQNQVRTNNSTSLPQTGNLNSANTGNSTRPNTNSNANANSNASTTTTTAQVRPGGTVRLTPGGSANAAPGAITPGTGALPIRIAPLERELVTNRPAAVIQPPAPAPVETTTPTPQTPSQPVEAVIETPAVGALDTDGAGPQSSFNPDFTQVQPGGRTTPRPEIRSSAAQPQRPQTQQQQQQQQQTAVDPPVKVIPPNPIEEYVKAQNLRLANVVLGSTNVAIFQSRDGFLVLPVGSTLPNSEILIRSLNAREALLVQGSDELNLPVQNP